MKLAYLEGGGQRSNEAWGWVRAHLNGFFQKAVDGDITQLPAQFLIGEDGVIHTAFYGKNLADVIPWWRVNRFLGEKKSAPSGSQRAGASTSLP